MKIYNTLTNKMENFVPIEKNKLKLYVCGPTVYNYIHLGNARPVVVFDTLARFFKYKGYEVEYVQNFTDIDDKIIKKAVEEKSCAKEIAQKYIQAFFEDTEKLNILSDIIRPRVTENIKEIIEIIEKLVEKGYAYESDGDVFFNVKKYEEYGKLSNQKIEELESGSRVEILDKKENPLDFTLWKKKKEGEPYWESPWGLGRPGWHIECSAMAKKYLGDTFDIHGGGQDLIFPHHENEIAQSRCAYDGKFAQYWMHNGFVQIDGEKMSKSVGNFLLLRELLKKFDGNVLRMFILSTHYRKPVNFSLESVEETKKTLNNVKLTFRRYKNIIDECANLNAHIKELEDIDFIKKIKELDKKIIDALEDDLNTPQAFGFIFEQIKEANKFYDKIVVEKNVEEIMALKFCYDLLVEKFETILGIEVIKENNVIQGEDEKMTKDLIELLVKIRKDARVEKNFKLSDEIRDGLKEIGVEIKDNKDGSTTYEILS